MKNWRVTTILIFIFIFGAAVIGRLIFLQVINRSYYQALAQGQQKFFKEIQGDRGDILLENSGLAATPYILASNKISQLCYVSPNEIEKKEETAQVLSEILNLEKDLILEQLSKENFYQVIKKKLSDEELVAIKEKNLTGVYIGEETYRYYPYDTLAAHLIGFLGGEGIGQYGIEGYWNDVLEGEKGFVEKGRGPLGFLIKADSEKESGIQKGADLVLTLDYNIQFVAEKLLKKAKDDLNIEEGQIIVIDPNSGKIFALANFPSFDPNQYSKAEDLSIFQNGGLQKIFEPGSVFKPITMSVALDQGKITPQTTYTDPGIINIGGWPIYNYDQRVYPGEITMTEVLEKSINTGAVFAERQIGHDIFLDYIKKFGFFERTGIDLDGEIFSENKNLKKGYEVNFATASFGQGIGITPIQLVRAFSTIANGGKLVKPYVVDKIIPVGGGVIETKPEITNNIISQKTASQITAMMVSVTEHGFAKSAQVPGYYVAGKTGTAQISWAALEVDRSGYSEKTIQSFVGFAPAFNPRFLILVKLNNPKTKTAEYSAVPLFQELAKYILDYWQVPSDYQ